MRIGCVNEHDALYVVSYSIRIIVIVVKSHRVVKWESTL